jgi:hypothetical protein
MKTKSKIWIYPLIAMGIVIMLTSSCKKEDEKAALEIGQEYQGGKIAYILMLFDPGYSVNVQHGIIAAPGDQSDSIRWYAGNYTQVYSSATVIGSGSLNTNLIVAVQGNNNYAAKLCADLVLGGYSDWYLPSKDELNMLYLNQAATGGFANAIYWSSSEGSSNYSAIDQDFTNGIQGYDSKNYGYHVRCIRSF